MLNIQSLKEEQKGSVSLKVVIFDKEDLQYAIDIHKRYPDVELFLQVGNDDLETEEQEKLVFHLLDKYEQLVDLVMNSEELNNVRILPQLHTYLWGNKRGV